jgi:hypothetical protein
MATLNLDAALVTAVAVTVSLLVSRFSPSRISAQTSELHKKLAQNVEALIERDLESELFNLSSLVEEEVNSDLNQIEKSVEPKKSINFFILAPVLIMLLNAMIIFFFGKELIIVGSEALIGVGSAMLSAHLAIMTFSNFQRSNRTLTP